MFERCTIFDYEVEIDIEKTEQWYAHAEEWGCNCGDCLNFLELARRKKLPHTVLNQLSSFGIPPEKATYVCLLTENGGKHLYQFSYRVVGNILKDSKSSVVEEGRCCYETYPYGAPNFPEPHFDLEFIVDLPWLLEKQRGE